MTFAQLEAATARLGFTPSLDDGGELLRDAATRAIGEVALARPRIARVFLWHYPDIPIYSESSTASKDGEHRITLGGGGSFYARIVGKGTLRIERSNAVTEYAFQAKEGERPATVSGSVPKGTGEVVFRFIPKDSLRLLFFAVYDAAYTAAPQDPAGSKEYHLPSYFPDFGALVGPIGAEGGEILREGDGGDYTLKDQSTLLIHRKTPCRIELSYRRTLSLPASGDLPLTDEEAALLPLFCAAYVFLDDDPEKAAFYLARYREGLLRLSQEIKTPIGYRDTTGWG